MVFRVQNIFAFGDRCGQEQRQGALKLQLALSLIGINKFLCCALKA